jgi:hypothetical protein
VFSATPDCTIVGANVEAMQLSLNRLADVLAFAQHFKGKYQRLDLVIFIYLVNFLKK